MTDQGYPPRDDDPYADPPGDEDGLNSESQDPYDDAGAYGNEDSSSEPLGDDNSYELAEQPEESAPAAHDGAAQQKPVTPGTGSVTGSGFTCRNCGYDLTGATLGGNCPECGALITASNQYAVPPTAGKAITSLVLGICSIPLCMCYGLPSVICGGLAIFFWYQARADMQGGNYSQNSESMNTAGLVCGIIGLTLGLLYIALAVVFIVADTMTP